MKSMITDRPGDRECKAGASTESAACGLAFVGRSQKAQSRKRWAVRCCERSGARRMEDGVVELNGGRHVELQPEAASRHEFLGGRFGPREVPGVAHLRRRGAGERPVRSFGPAVTLGAL